VRLGTEAMVHKVPGEFFQPGEGEREPLTVEEQARLDALSNGRVPVPSFEEKYAADLAEVKAEEGRAYAEYLEQRAAEDVKAEEMRADLVHLSNVQPTTVQSLWGGTRVARGKLSLWEGDPGIGKSYVSLRMMADLSQTGQRSLLMQVEDGLSDTTRPRLDRLGADLDLIRSFASGKAPVLDAEGRAKLEWHVKDWRPSLVVVDPVTYFLGAKVDMHRANEVRECLADLARIAEQYDCAIVPIIHMNKGSQKALYRALGSIDFTAAVRSVLLFGCAEHEPDRGSAMFHIKCNYGAKEEPFGFDISDDGFAWRASTDLTVADIEGRKPGPKPKKRNECRDWLRGVLADGPKDGALVKAAAEDAGFTAKTLKLVSEEDWVVKERVEGSRSVAWSIHPIVAAPSTW